MAREAREARSDDGDTYTYSGSATSDVAARGGSGSGSGSVLTAAASNSLYSYYSSDAASELPFVNAVSVSPRSPPQHVFTSPTSTVTLSYAPPHPTLHRPIDNVALAFQSVPPRPSPQTWSERVGSLVNSNGFTFLSMLLIALNLVNLSLRASAPTLVHALEFVFLALFTVELGLRAIASGLTGFAGILTNPTAVADVAIVIFSWISVLGCPGIRGRNLTSLRGIQLLAPLSRCYGLRALAVARSALRLARAVLLEVLLFLVFVTAIYALIALYLFAGSLRHRCFGPGPRDSWRAGRLCSSSHPCEASRNETCVALAANPQRNLLSFDNIGYAILALFSIMSRDGWTFILTSTQAATHPAAWLYFATFIVLTVLLIASLVVVILTEALAEAEQRVRGRTTLVLPGRGCGIAGSRSAARIANGRRLAALSVATTVINAVAVAVHAHDVPRGAVVVARIVNVACVVLAVGEGAVRVAGGGLNGLLASRALALEVFLAVLAVVDLAADWTRALSTLRLLLLPLWIQTAFRGRTEPLDRALAFAADFASSAGHALAAVMVTVAASVFALGLLGLQLFSIGAGAGSGALSGYQSTGTALTQVLRFLTGDDSLRLMFRGLAGSLADGIVFYLPLTLVGVILRHGLIAVVLNQLCLAGDLRAVESGRSNGATPSIATDTNTGAATNNASTPGSTAVPGSGLRKVGWAHSTRLSREAAAEVLARPVSAAASSPDSAAGGGGGGAELPKLRRVAALLYWHRIREEFGDRSGPFASISRPLRRSMSFVSLFARRAKTHTIWDVIFQKLQLRPRREEDSENGVELGEARFTLFARERIDERIVDHNSSSLASEAASDAPSVDSDEIEPDAVQLPKSVASLLATEDGLPTFTAVVEAKANLTLYKNIKLRHVASPERIQQSVAAASTLAARQQERRRALELRSEGALSRGPVASPTIQAAMESLENSQSLAGGPTSPPPKTRAETRAEAAALPPIELDESGFAVKRSRFTFATLASQIAEKPAPDARTYAIAYRDREVEAAAFAAARRAHDMAQRSLPRRLAYLLESSPWMRSAVVSAVFFGTVMMVLDSPAVAPHTLLASLVSATDWICQVLFTIEALVAVAARGLVGAPYGLLRSPRRACDLLIVLLCWPGVIAGRASGLALLRALRGLRPLRFLTLVPVLRRHLGPFYAGRAYLALATVSLLTLWLVFGLIGMGLFNATAAVGHCTDSAVAGVRACNGTYVTEDGLQSWRVWVPDSFRFTNLGEAMGAALRFSALDGWGAALSSLLASPAIAPAAATAMRVYFFAYAVIGGLFAQSLIAAALLVGVFLLPPERPTPITSKIERVRAFCRFSVGEVLEPAVVMPADASCMRAMAFRLVTAPAFNAFISVVIVVNMVLLACHHYDEPERLAAWLSGLNVFFVVVYILEMLLKLYGLGPGTYARSGWNLFDAFVVAISVIGLLVQTTVVGPYFQATRAIRLLRLTRRTAALYRLVIALFRAVQGCVIALVVSLLFMTAYCIAGMALFGRACVNPLGAARPLFWRFDGALLTMAQVAFADRWTEVLDDTLRGQGDCGIAGARAVYLFFGSYMFLVVPLCTSLFAIAVWEAVVVSLSVKSHADRIKGMLIRRWRAECDGDFRQVLPPRSVMRALNRMPFGYDLGCQAMTAKISMLRRFEPGTKSDIDSVIQVHLESRGVPLAPAAEAEYCFGAPLAWYCFRVNEPGMSFTDVLTSLLCL